MLQRTWLAVAIGLIVASATGCDIVKETIEQTITEQSIRIGDELEQQARERADAAREAAIGAAFGGGEEASTESTESAVDRGALPSKKPNDETFDEFN